MSTADINHDFFFLPPSYSPLAEQFALQFPGHDLPSMLAKFSLPVSLSEFRNPLDAPVHEVSVSRLFTISDKQQTGSHSVSMESSTEALWSSVHRQMLNFRIQFELQML